MMNYEKRKGIWIPIEVMKCADLDCTDKFLLSEIISLHKLNNGCHASNEFFAEMLNITRSAASKRITKLSEKGFIKAKKRYNKQRCIGRMITPTDKIHVCTAISTAQGEENGSSHKNHSEQSLTLDGVSQKNHDVPERPGGSSQTTIGVVPERLEGSSPGNTTNTYNNSNIINTNKKTDLEKQLLVQDSGENFVEVLSINDQNSNTSPGSCGLSRQEHRSVLNSIFYDHPNWEQEMLMSSSTDGFLKKYNYCIEREIRNNLVEYKTNDQDDVRKFLVKLITAYYYR